MTGRMMEQIEKVLLAEQPDWVVVYGDTNSTIAGALAAKKLHIKVAHIEAGLRSFNDKMPEEINRILTDRISDVLFCPTMTAVKNLQNEAYDNYKCKIARTGDVMQDAALFFAKKAVKPDVEIPKKFILATIHRAENTDDLDRLNSIFEAFNEIGSEIPVLLPLHPRTKKIIRNNNIKIKSDNIKIIEAVGYLEMIYLLKNCQMVMTDSGGLQKEAYFFRKFCLTLRDETEWVELVENGFNIIVSADKSRIVDGYKTAKKAKPDFDKQLYGGGKASAEIIRILKNHS
jgi:UDP-GlcNAc3NAcA epimerase